VARPEAPATVHGRPVKFLCVEDRVQRPAHLVTPAGSYQMESTIRYAPELNFAPYNSPFRPHRLGQHMVTHVEVTREDVLVHTTTGGTVRYPTSQVAYSWME
jgi:hypothetical protein